jgi:hypothetical protein
MKRHTVAARKTKVSAASHEFRRKSIYCCTPYRLPVWTLSAIHTALGPAAGSRRT